MSNYTKATNFATKDTLPSGNSGKIVKGTEIDDEFNAIASAISSKADTASPSFTGTPAAPTAASGSNTTQIATTAFVTNAVTDERTATATLTGKTVNLTSNTLTGTVAQFNTALSDGDFATLAGTETLTNKTLTSPALSSPAMSGTPTAPTASSGTNTTQVATTAFVTAAITTAILSQIYPVGSVYINASSTTNPGTLLGFGTWTEMGAGRVLVNQDTSDASFDTLAETGGAKTVTSTGSISGTVGGTALTEAQMPKHYHQMIGPNSVTAPQDDDGTSFGLYGGGTADDGAQRYGTYSTGGSAASGSASIGTSNGDSHTHSFSATFTGDASSVVQPYVVVKMWKRTA